MKKNNDFILKEIGAQTVLVPFGDKALNFDGILTINDTAKFLWEICDEEIDIEKLVNELKAKYEIDDATAKEGVDLFINQLKEAGCIEE